MVGGAAWELVGVGAVIPLLAAVVDPERLIRAAAFTPLRDLLTPENVLWIACLSVFGLFVLKNAYLALLTLAKSRFVARAKVALETQLFQGYLHAPYEFHLARNSAQSISNIQHVTGAVYHVLLPMLVFASELLVFAGISCLLLWVQPFATIAAFAACGIVSFVLMRTLKGRVSALGENQVRLNRALLQSKQQALHGIKDVKVLARQAHFLDGFHRFAIELARTGAQLQVLNQVPRIVLEIAVVGGIMLVVVIVTSTARDTTSALTSIALLATAALRLMPSLNRMLASAISIRAYAPAVRLVHEDLMQTAGYAPRLDAALAPSKTPALSGLNHSIELEDVCFAYAGARDRPALRNVTLAISKGTSAAFVGQSGAGKTTLVDLLLGLLRPTSGRVLADGIAVGDLGEGWLRTIGYVPQTVYLADDTLARNVAFGLPDALIDRARIQAALEMAHLSDLVATLPQGIDASIGEHGGRLSGGQRQRIGIARALYHDPEVIILDEATAALDSETEHQISEAVRSLIGRKTVIIIAHRLSTIRHCDAIYFLDDGTLAGSGTFDELYRSSADFRRLCEFAMLKLPGDP
ncbi:MAG: ABC transporter ATP-binding protein [Candidatus Parcubacteria bacterium]|nr:ABC transporter ATP-binding protein [Burkholderiales bacterium]